MTRSVARPSDKGQLAGLPGRSETKGRQVPSVTRRRSPRCRRSGTRGWLQRRLRAGLEAGVCNLRTARGLG